MRDKSVTHDFHKLGVEKELSLFPARSQQVPKGRFPQEARQTGSNAALHEAGLADRALPSPIARLVPRGVR